MEAPEEIKKYYGKDTTYYETILKRRDLLTVWIGDYLVRAYSDHVSFCYKDDVDYR